MSINHLHSHRLGCRMSANALFYPHIGFVWTEKNVDNTMSRIFQMLRKSYETTPT